MERRSFLKAAAAIPAAGLAEKLASSAEAASPSAKPNILFIFCDELRYPSVFPAGINSVDGFLQKFMPNVHKLWLQGVKFANHFTAATACTPSRGVLLTGLYSQQSWLLQTIKDTPGTDAANNPVLNTAYPTYGKLLQQAGYRTPYIGKFHVAYTDPSTGLSAYGFEEGTYYDPTGANLQGSVGDHANGYLSDVDIANQAAAWLESNSHSSQPWCLTVAFVNPHDQEFFWAGTQFDLYNGLFDNQSTYVPFTYYSSNKGMDYPPVVSVQNNPLKNPSNYGYPEAPPNWETADQIRAKPKSQTFNKTFMAALFGDVTDDHTQAGFSIAQYPNPNGYSQLAGLGIASAPYAYWQRSLDTYTKCMTLVDEQIGTVLNALPADVAKNTIIVFTSDHGDYAGAHGFPAGKTGSVYDEAFHLPLIVYDPSGRFTGDTGSIRTGLTSSVDMLGMLVSFAYGGTRNWITPELASPYASRHDMIPMLKSKDAPGRDYVLLVSDEIVPNFYNWLNAGLHIIGVRTQFGKLGVYAHWTPTGDIDRTQLIETEYYDYATIDGQLELTSTPYSPAAQTLLSALPAIINNELRAPIALNLRLPQATLKAHYLVYSAILANLPGNQRSALAYGADF